MKPKTFGPATEAAWARREGQTSKIIEERLGGEGVETLKLIGEVYKMAFEEGVATVLRKVGRMVDDFFPEEVRNGEATNN